MKEAPLPPRKPGWAMMRACGSTLPAIPRTPEQILAARSMSPGKSNKTPAERLAARCMMPERNTYDLLDRRRDLPTK